MLSRVVLEYIHAIAFVTRLNLTILFYSRCAKPHNVYGMVTTVACFMHFILSLGGDSRDTFISISQVICPIEAYKEI